MWDPPRFGHVATGASGSTLDPALFNGALQAGSFLGGTSVQAATRSVPSSGRHTLTLEKRFAALT